MFHHCYINSSPNINKEKPRNKHRVHISAPPPPIMISFFGVFWVPPRAGTEGFATATLFRRPPESSDNYHTPELGPLSWFLMVQRCCFISQSEFDPCGR